MTALGILGFADALTPRQSLALPLLAAAVAILGLLAHFRSASWSLRVMAPHWPRRASAAMAVMGPILVAGFALSLTMVAALSHHPLVYSALSVVFCSLVAVSLFFSLFLRPALPGKTWPLMIVLLYIVPVTSILYSLISENPWGSIIASLSALCGMFWHNRDLLETAPFSASPELWLSAGTERTGKRHRR
jgi:hypothetical protein